MISIVYERSIGGDDKQLMGMILIMRFKIDNNVEDDCRRLNGWNGFNFIIQSSKDTPVWFAYLCGNIIPQ